MTRGQHAWSWWALFFILLFFSESIRSFIDQVREDHNLSVQGEQIEDAPPELNMALGMGVFRSVIIDYLWLRASKLQRERRYYEIVQLYDMIGKLQPYNAKVWAYSAWNMAYNISVTFPPGEERWRWVQNGLERLLGPGLRYNPENLAIYKEIAWIYSHKMGGNTDDSHLLYKTKLCEWIQDIAGAERLNARKVVEDLNSDDPVVREKAFEIQKRLFFELTLEVEFMAHLESEPRLGPLDWRNPKTIAIYWAQRGIYIGNYGARTVELQRLIYQAQQHMLRQGNIVYTPATEEAPSRVDVWPDYRFAFPIHRQMLYQIKTVFKREKAIDTGIRSAYRHFMVEAVRILILSGQETIAERIFSEAKKEVPEQFSEFNARELMEKTIDEQIANLGPEQFSAMVSATLMRYYWWVAQGDNKRSKALMVYATQIWNKNLQKNKTDERRVNQTLDGLKKSVLKDIINRKMFHPLVIEKLKAVLDIQEEKSLN